MVEDKKTILNAQDDAYAKHPDDLYVLDKDGWTKATKLIRKRKNKKMYFIKNKGSRSVIVTEDHPMITPQGPASSLTQNDSLFTVDLSYILKDEKIFHIDRIDLLREVLDRKIFKIINGKSERKGRDKIYFNGIYVEKLSLSQIRQKQQLASVFCNYGLFAKIGISRNKPEHKKIIRFSIINPSLYTLSTQSVICLSNTLSNTACLPSFRIFT